MRCIAEKSARALYYSQKQNTRWWRRGREGPMEEATGDGKWAMGNGKLAIGKANAINSQIARTDSL